MSASVNSQHFNFQNTGARILKDKSGHPLRGADPEGNVMQGREVGTGPNQPSHEPSGTATCGFGRDDFLHL